MHDGMAGTPTQAGLAVFEPGDVLMVSRLDRLARSTRDLLSILLALRLPHRRNRRRTSIGELMGARLLHRSGAPAY